MASSGGLARSGEWFFVVKLALANRLKRREHVETALLQDEVVEGLFSRFGECGFVLRGGTAVWRCHGGNRFSEDLDFYGLKRGLAGFKEKFLAFASSRGLTVSKFKETANTVFAKVSNGRVEARVEVSVVESADEIFKRVGFGGETSGVTGGDGVVVAGEFEKTDGGVMAVRVLSAAALLREKIAAYSSRRLARDFYDVYFLSRLADDADSAAVLKRFLGASAGGGVKPPADEENLEALVYGGVAPSFNEMLEVVASRAGIRLKDLEESKAKAKPEAKPEAKQKPKPARKHGRR